MGKGKKILYLVKTLLLPLILIAIISILLSSFFELTDYDGNGFLIKLSKITFNHPKRAACIFLFVIQLFIIRKFINKNKDFAPTNIYGDYPIVIYFLAWLLMGYKKVNLKMKPIPLQFQLLNFNFLECYDDTEYIEEDYDYNIEYKGKINKKTDIVNIVVADTYPIAIEQLPKKVKENYTIIISRNGNSGIRINSKKLVKIMVDEVQNIKSQCKKFNLFLTTPGLTNKSIFQNVFQTGNRDGFSIYIYQQDSNNNFKFKDKPIHIKC